MMKKELTLNEFNELLREVKNWDLAVELSKKKEVINRFISMRKEKGNS